MSDAAYLRKSQPAQPLPTEGQSGLEVCLLRVMFGIPDDNDEERLCAAKVPYLGETYAVKELAADMGLSPFAVYKMFSEERPIRFASALRVLDYVRWKNPDDTRLADFIIAHAGMIAMPRTADADTVRKIAALVDDIKGR